jgi:hypothetical protein
LCHFPERAFDHLIAAFRARARFGVEEDWYWLAVALRPRDHTRDRNPSDDLELLFDREGAEAVAVPGSAVMAPNDQRRRTSLRFPDLEPVASFTV